MPILEWQLQLVIAIFKWQTRSRPKPASRVLAPRKQPSPNCSSKHLEVRFHPKNSVCIGWPIRMPGSTLNGSRVLAFSLNIGSGRVQVQVQVGSSFRLLGPAMPESSGFGSSFRLVGTQRPPFGFYPVITSGGDRLPERRCQYETYCSSPLTFVDKVCAHSGS